MSSNYDYLFKLLVIGDSSVGKTCILYRLCEEAFNPDFISTIGIDFKMKSLMLDSKKIKLQIWDTAGQERFRTITTAYYRGAMGIFIVFDVTSKQSFDNVGLWFKSVDENASPEAVKIVMGNKCDLSDRAVSYEQAKQFAAQYGAKYLEVSAKTGLNVLNSFTEMATEVKNCMDDKLKTETPTPQVALSSQEAYQSSPSGGCC